jgi:ATP-dependent DNA helicase RecG
MIPLSERDIKYLPGVGPYRAELLEKDADVHNCEDLLCYFPYKYIDRSQIYSVRELRSDMPYVQVRGKFVSLKTSGVGRNQRLNAEFTDGTGVMDVVWFKGLQYIRDTINANEEYILFGKPSVFNGRISIAHPEMEKASKVNFFVGVLQPFYNTSEKMKNGGLNSKALHKIISSFLSNENTIIEETLPEYLTTKYHLMPRNMAIRILHQPTDVTSLEQARFRMKFEELFYVQLNILRSRNISRSQVPGFVFNHVGAYFNSFYKDYIPFEPTGAQKRVVKEIRADMCSGRQMNRLLQGDVGSGKTLVALMSMLLAVDNGFQTCIMAPTEILATQHYESVKEMLGDMSLNVALLTGSTKKKRRDEILTQLREGDLHIIIGTHALIEDTVVFKNIGLAVIDEQHRFGVAQRAKLWQKNITPPHVLVMTATPIPRTLAMTIYGDLDVSVIDELPPGRKPVLTEHYFHNSRNSLNRFLRGEIQKGRQVYVVYPLIEESERMDYKNLVEGYEYMQSAFPEYKVCMVHGKLKPAEKDEAMQSFARGESQIMVATTVIEVGVNVPNASVMVIESAERFGLSQLHQLRGRVGRGAEQSYCILMTGHKLGDDTTKRMEVMVRTTDGFEISEADLKLRGPGSMEGTQQSGLPFALKIANLAKDSKLVQYTRDVAEEVLRSDSLLQSPINVILLKQLFRLAKQQANWSLIS